MQKQINETLIELGEDPSREGLRDTPARVIKMYKELLSGYALDAKLICKKFDSPNYHGLITVANIPFYSLCEHHLIPFFGKAHIAYVPDKKILGLSKFARLVDMYAKRLQTQEHLTKQLFDSTLSELKPKGLIVQLEAEHLCMSMRGVSKPGTTTITTLTNPYLQKRSDLLLQFQKNIR